MRVLLSLIKHMRTWDTPSKIALAIAVSLLVISLIVVYTVPELRRAATIGAVGLFIAVQMIILWGNRNLVTPHTEAQRHFIAGDFIAARDTLLAWRDERANEKKALPIDSLVLLGNAYRNLGDLDHSRRVLQQARERDPDYHFALYGLGRTYLAMGEYNSAVDLIEQAIDKGAPDVTRFDLAHAEYRRENWETVERLLPTIPQSDDHHRRLFVDYFYHRIMNHTAPDKTLIEAGLVFWQAEVERFSHTRYGQDVQADIQALRALL